MIEISSNWTVNFFDFLWADSVDHWVQQITCPVLNEIGFMSQW